jgi:hypothetical protein
VENSSLKGVLPKVFARQNLDPTSLGELIDLVGNIALGDAKARSAGIRRILIVFCIELSPFRFIWEFFPICYNSD